MEDAVTQIAEYGFDAIETSGNLTRLSPIVYRTKASRKKLKEFIDSKGIVIADVDLRSALSIPSANVREHQLILFDVLCQMAVDFDCDLVKVDQAGAAQAADRNIPWSQQRAWLVASLKHCAKIAEDYGVKCGLHNHTNATVRENLEMITEIGAESLMLIIDADNATVLHEDVVETTLLAAKAKKLSSVQHIKDHKREIVYRTTGRQSVYSGMETVEVRRRVNAGEGIVDNVGFVKALKSSGWDGYLSLEASWGTEELVHGLNWMKNTWKSL
jgi:sugar phosphate isomerase/epimerase